MNSQLEVLEALVAQQEELNSKKHDVLVEIKNQREKMFNFYFGPLLEEGDSLRVGNNNESISIFRRVESEDYSKEIISIYFRNKTWRFDGNDEYSINVNFYTTICSTDFEFKRMVLIGKVGALLLDKREEIIHEYKKCVYDLEKTQLDISSLLYSIEKNIKVIKEKIKLDKDNNIFNKAFNEFIYLKQPKTYSLKQSVSDYKIIGFKLIPNTDKTVHVKVIIPSMVWEEDKGYVSVEKEILIERVKIQVIKDLIFFNFD